MNTIMIAYLPQYIDEITSDISLTAFTYDDDDFDENGEYRGISKQTVIIKRS